MVERLRPDPWRTTARRPAPCRSPATRGLLYRPWSGKSAPVTGLLPTEAAKPRPTQFLVSSSSTWAPRPPSETVGPPASLALECGRSDPPWCCSNARRTDRGPGRCAPNPCCLRAPPSFSAWGCPWRLHPPGDTPLPLDGWSSHPGPGGDRRPCSFIFFSGKRTVWDPNRARMLDVCTASATGYRYWLLLPYLNI